MKTTRRERVAKSLGHSAAAGSAVRKIPPQEMLWRLFASVAIVLFISVGVLLLRSHGREEIAVVVPAIVRILFLTAMLLLTAKISMLIAAAKFVTQDPARAKRFYFLDHLTGVFILVVVCLTVAFLYHIPSYLAGVFTATFVGVRERTATIAAQLVSWIASGVVGNAAYNGLIHLLRRAVRRRN